MHTNRAGESPLAVVRSGPRAVKVAVAGPHLAVSQALASALAQQEGIAVTTVGGSLSELGEIVSGSPDVLVLDVDADGTAALHALHAAGASVRVVVLTGQGRPADWQALLAAGVAGVVAKSAPLDHVVNAVRAAAGGQIVIPAGSRQVAAVGSDAPRRGGRLTRRELEVLQLCADGLSTAAIAQRLFVTVNTVRTHVQNGLTKLGASSRLEAVSRAMSLALIDPPAGSRRT